jgi:signal transduction histidine kinase
VPAELRDAVFEPFQQGSGAPAHAPGLGIGLAVVMRLAELHGGHAWVRERAGGGACFHVLLPASTHDIPP